MYRLNSRIRVGILCSIFATVVILGCAKPVGAITGKVTYKGAPLKGGKILYYSDDDATRVVGTTINEDGTFEVPSILAGSYKVCIDTSSLDPSKKGSVGPPAGKGGGPPDKGGPPSKEKGKEGKEVEKKDVKPFDSSELKDQEHYKASNKDIMKKVGSHFVEIPQKYRSKESTDITFTVVAGPAQTHEIDLK